MDLNQVTLPCTDYDKTVQFYRNLGLSLIVDSPPNYARFETDLGATFSIHRTDSVNASPDVVIYFEVDNVDLTVRELEGLGFKFETEARDQDWLWREAYLLDPAGNMLCIYHAGENRRNPPWRVSEDAV